MADVFDVVSFEAVVQVAQAMRGEARAAASTQEAWAMRAVVALTGECDGAVTDDGVGFNKSDTNAGRYLGHYIASGGLLDDVEWQHAVEMLVKYHGQIGTCPRPDAQDEARMARVAALSEDEGFRARLTAVHKEAKRRKREVEKTVATFEQRLRHPEIVIGFDQQRQEWSVSAPFKEQAVQAWRDLHRQHGGRWNGDLRVRVVPYKGARAIHELLEQFYDGCVARGPKGYFVVGDGDAPVTLENDEAFEQHAAKLAVALLTLPALPVGLVGNGEGDEDGDEENAAQ